MRLFVVSASLAFSAVTLVACGGQVGTLTPLFTAPPSLTPTPTPTTASIAVADVPTATPTQRPAPTPSPTPSPLVSHSCSEFASWGDAVRFFVASGGPESDPYQLDVDRDGVPCEGLSGAPIADLPAPTPAFETLTPTPTAWPDPSPSPTPSPTQSPLAEASPTPTPTPTAASSSPGSTPTPVLSTPAPVVVVTPPPTATPTPSGLLYDPSGPDRNCGDFQTWQQAKDFFDAAATAENPDPDGLDHDKDGIPCESLPGAPK